MELLPAIVNDPSPRYLPELTNLDVGEKALRCNQEERLREQEQHLHIFQTAFMKEQQNLQTRERSIRSIERTLNEETERVPEKERHLDVRILEITRLEARLHDALLQQEQNLQQKPQQAEVIRPNNEHSERESILDLRERGIVLSQAKVDERNNHLQAKERVLNEKEAGLLDFQSELERRERRGDTRVKLLEDKLNTRHTRKMASVEATRRELEVRHVHLEARQEIVANCERASSAQEVALEQTQQLLSRQYEANLMQQEDNLIRNVQLHENVSAAKENVPDSHSVQLGNGHQGNEAGETEVQPQQLKRKGTLGRFFK